MAHPDGPPEESFVIVGHEQLDESRPGRIVAEAAPDADFEHLSATAVAAAEDARPQEPSMEDISASTVHVRLPGRPGWPPLRSMLAADWSFCGAPGESVLELRPIRVPLSQPARLAEPAGLAAPAGTRRRVIPITSLDEPSAPPAPPRDAAGDSPTSAAVRSFYQATATAPAAPAGAARPREAPVADSPPEAFVPKHIPGATTTWVDHAARRSRQARPTPAAVPAANYRRASLEECALSVHQR